MLFHMEGERCDHERNFTSIVIFACSYDFFDQRLTFISRDDCTLHFSWSTEFACWPRYSHEMQNPACLVNDTKNEYNLNFMRYSQMPIDFFPNDSRYFLINFCEPVEYSSKSMCPPGSAVCLVDDEALDLSQRFVSYGNFSELQIDNEPDQQELIAVYKSDRPCSSNSSLTEGVKVRLICSEIEVGPIFVKRDECDYLFEYLTKSACPRYGSCTALNKTSNLEIDLSALMQQTFTVQYEDKNIHFGICGEPENNCLKRQGACMRDYESGKIMNLGNPSTRFITNDSDIHVLYLEYDNGDKCQGSLKWSTTIEIRCANDKESVQVTEFSNCHIHIKLYTHLLCYPPIPCTFTSEDGVLYDLSPIQNNKLNSKALISKELKETHRNYTYVIKVCQPLVYESTMACPVGAGVCRVNKTRDEKHKNHGISLGYPDVRLTAVDGVPLLEYRNGEVCDADPTQRYSTEIGFRCNVNAGYVGLFFLLN